MSNYSVKAFLESDDKPVEVRRFAMTRAEAKSFAILCEKLQTVFGTKLTKDEYAIYWKDEEGDRIRASSDDELVYALKSLKDDVFKIYIQPAKPNFSAPGGKNHHVGVVCDHCNEEIYGFRYKCMQCSDFDLCSNCEYQGNHTEHNMIRMSSPMKPGQRSHYSWKFRPRHGFRHNFSSRCPGAAEDTPGVKRSSTEGRRNRSPRFGEPFHPYNLLSKMWSAIGGMNLDPEAPNFNANQPESHPETKEGENNESHSPEEEYLRNIGETVAAVLDPFGIDVIVGVEHNGVRTDINPKNSDETTQTNQSTDNQHLDAETGVTAQKDRAKGGVEMDVNTEGASTGNMDTNEWTYIEAENEKADGAEAMQNIPEMMEKVHINENEPIHPDPLIAEAAATMMSMGFDNENGWLTSLLDLNGGNIDRVFEVLAELGQPEGPTRKFIETFLGLLKRNGGDTAKVVAIMQSMNKRK